MNKKKENALNLNLPYEEVLAFKEFDAYESLLLRYLIRKESKGFKSDGLKRGYGGMIESLSKAYCSNSFLANSHWTTGPVNKTQ